MSTYNISAADVYKLSRTLEVPVLDVRSSEEFGNGFVPGSFFCGNTAESLYWITLFFPSAVKPVIVTADGKVGKDDWFNTDGYTILEGGYAKYAAEKLPVDMIISVEADELAMDLPFDENLVLLDVRSQTEFDLGHVTEANHLPLQQLTDLAQLSNIAEEANIYVYSGHGMRSMVACSWMRLQGYEKLRNVTGGYQAIAAEPGLNKEAAKSSLN